MREQIKHFFESEAFAIVGVSQNPKKFGHAVFKEFKERNIKVYPVNKNHDSINNEKCYKSVEALPDGVQSIVTVVPPTETTIVVEEAIKKGIKKIWMQQGSKSEEAVNLCKNANVSVVTDECVLMFLEPVKSFHAFHRWLNKLFGKYPK